MKHFLLNTIRSIFMSISIFMFITIIQLIISSGLDLLLTTLIRVLALLVLVLLFRWLGSRTGLIDTEEKFKEEFKDVIKFNRTIISVLGAVSLILFVAFIKVNCLPTVETLETKYPDAESFIQEKYGINDKEWPLIKSLPAPVMGMLFSYAQSYSDLLQYADDNENCTNDELVAEYNRITSQHSDDINSYRLKASFSILLLFSFSYCYVLSYRCAQYLELKKELYPGGK